MSKRVHLTTWISRESNEFALKHRYAFTLHTDEPHPHVHLVVRAVSEGGQRLNIRKATLRHWRQLFATHLREQGVAANATERAVRGQSRIARSDGIFRATQRNALMHCGQRHRQRADELKEVAAQKLSGRAVLERTRAEVLAGWRGVARLLHDAGDFALAEEVIAFARQMPAVRLQQELISVQAGVDLYTVKELLGHSEIAMTERYAHLAPDNLRVAVDKAMSERPSPASSAS